MLDSGLKLQSGLIGERVMLCDIISQFISGPLLFFLCFKCETIQNEGGKKTFKKNIIKKTLKNLDPQKTFDNDDKK